MTKQEFDLLMAGMGSFGWAICFGCLAFYRKTVDENSKIWRIIFWFGIALAMGSYFIPKFVLF